MALSQYSRVKQKRTIVSGQTPTIAPSNDHTDGTWVDTDIYPGEFYMNMGDLTGYIGLSGGTGQFQFFSAGTSTPFVFTTETYWDYQPITITQTGAETYNIGYNDNYAGQGMRKYVIEKTYTAGSTGEILDLTSIIFEPSGTAPNGTIFFFQAMLLLYDDTAGDVLCGQINGRDIQGGNYPYQECIFKYVNSSTLYYPQPTGARWNLDASTFPYGTFDTDSNFSVVNVTTGNVGVEINLTFDTGLVNDTIMKLHFWIRKQNY